jgi:hypothetical protein
MAEGTRFERVPAFLRGLGLANRPVTDSGSLPWEEWSTGPGSNRPEHALQACRPSMEQPVHGGVRRSCTSGVHPLGNGSTDRRNRYYATTPKMEERTGFEPATVLPAHGFQPCCRAHDDLSMVPAGRFELPKPRF